MGIAISISRDGDQTAQLMDVSSYVVIAVQATDDSPTFSYQGDASRLIPLIEQVKLDMGLKTLESMLSATVERLWKSRSTPSLDEHGG